MGHRGAIRSGAFSPATRGLSPGLIKGLVGAVFVFVGLILIYAAWDGRRQLDPVRLAREAEIQNNERQTAAAVASEGGRAASAKRRAGR